MRTAFGWQRHLGVGVIGARSWRGVFHGAHDPWYWYLPDPPKKIAT